MKRYITILIIGVVALWLVSAKSVLSVSVTTSYKTYVATDSGMIYVDVYNNSFSPNVVVVFRIDSVTNRFYDSVLIAPAIDSLHPSQREYQHYVYKGDTVRVKSNLNGALTLIGRF